MKFFNIILLFLFLSSIVSAFNIQLNIIDYNSLAPLESVNITLINNTQNIILTTNSLGYALTSSDESYFNVTIIKAGYFPSYEFLNVTNDTTVQYKLMGINNLGIIKLIFEDLTLTQHQFCLYFKDNNRLYKCYFGNDTVEIHNNYNYTLIPKINKQDILFSSSGIKNYGYLYVPTLIGISFILSVFLIIIYFVIRIIFNAFLNKRKGG